MAHNNTLKNICLAVVVATIPLLGFSQSLYPPKVESPNAASLGKFGEVPVNLFTGTPNISIPLHTVSYGNINVPISLRYNPSSVKPVQQPGWVGDGWDLESIGTISRQVRGALDEFYIDGSTGNATGPNTAFYYPYPGENVTPGADYANLSNWNTTNQLAFDFTGQPNFAGLDVQADEFSFNVMGHSGKFYYEGASNGWKVVSEENITVQVNSFLSPLNITSAIKQYTSIPTIPNYVTTSVNQSRMFGSFILTVPDGTKYYFGDVNNSGIGDAVEFSSPFMSHDASGSGNATPDFTANTWLLKKIIDAKNNEVDFSYARKYPTCNLNLGFNELNASCAQNNVSVASFLFFGGLFGVPLIGNSATYSSDYVNTNMHYGIFQWPMYLSKISTPNENVNFLSSEAVCSRYTNDQIYYLDITNKSGGGFYADNMQVNINPQYINWEQLNTISITDNMHNSSGVNNYSPNIIKQFQFNYSNSSSQRLTLNSMQQLVNKSQVVGQYAFAYNPDFNSTNSTTMYADGNFTDHWGFFNNTDISTARSADLFSRKQPNPAVVGTGLLNALTYPTGGKSLITWEANDYSRVVTVNRQAYNQNTGYGGGPRVAEIKNLLTDGSVATDKKYYYKSGYTANATVSSLPSSGVLNGTPQYAFSLTNRRGVLNSTINNVQLTSFNGTGNYSYTGQGSPIGYDEVVEVNPDGSYIKNVFTNYGTDVNGVSHWDIAPSGYLGWDPTQDNYFPRGSLELERGKLIAIYNYSSTNTLLQQTTETFRNDPARYNNTVNIIDLNGSYGSVACVDALVLATARPVYNYSYYPITKTVTTWDQSGGNPLVQTTQYISYNSNNLLQQKTETSSKGESIVTNIAYPTDYTDAVSQGMVAAHILSPIIQTSSINNGVPTILNKTNYSQPYAGVFVPQNIQQQVGGNSIETREQVNQFDAKGHPQETQKPNGVKEVYLWGCNSQYLMAKIVGSDYKTASPLIDQLKLDQAGTGYNSYTDADIRAELNKLRIGLPNAFVTTYTYACGVGITSETDPRGFVIYYNYDNFGRVSFIQDQDRNILKKFCYNYAGQPENCTTTGFTNDLQQATFTSTLCGAGTIAPTYTYTVPAGTFTSFVDKATANQLAINAMNTNGQATANAMPCLVAIAGTNTTTTPFNVLLTDATSGATFSLSSLYPGYSLTPLGNVPVSTYNISVTPYSGTVSGQFLINGAVQPSFSPSGIPITTATNFSVTSAAQSGPCSINMASGFGSPTNGITNNGTTASGYVVFYSGSTMSQGNSYLIGTITGGCVPSSTQTCTFSSNGVNWTSTIYGSGQVFVQMAYGSSPISANTTITAYLSYNL